MFSTSIFCLTLCMLQVLRVINACGPDQQCSTDSQLSVNRTRPVVSVSGTVDLSPDTIDLSTGGEARSRVTICMNYSGEGAPDNLNLRLDIELDAAQSAENKRARFLVSNSAKYGVERVELKKDQRDCNQQHYIIVFGTIRDKLSPIIVNVTYAVNDQDSRFAGGQLTPVKNALLPQHWSHQLQIANDCGPEQKCIPDLKLSAETSKPFLSRGLSERLNLSLVIVNTKLDAHQAKLYVNAPRGVSFVKSYAEEQGHRIFCSHLNVETDQTRLECDIGNPFKKGQKYRLQIEYQVIELSIDTNELVFKLEVNSSLPDDVVTRLDNRATIIVPLRLNVKVKINHLSAPDQYTYTKDSDRSADLNLNRVTDPTLVGPYISHTYAVKNDIMSSKIASARLDVFFPHFTQTNDFLLYILYDIRAEGNITCKAVQPQNINPLKWIIPRHPLSLDSSATARRRRSERRAPNAYDELGIGGSATGRSANMSNAFLDFVDKAKMMSKDLAASWETVKNSTVDCSQMHCTQWTCEIIDLQPGHVAAVTVNSTLFLRTLLMQNITRAAISSLAVVEVTKLPFRVPKSMQLPVEAATARTVVRRQQT